MPVGFVNKFPEEIHGRTFEVISCWNSRWNPQNVLKKSLEIKIYFLKLISDGITAGVSEKSLDVISEDSEDQPASAWESR